MASIFSTKKSKYPVTRVPGSAHLSYYRGVCIFKNSSAPAHRRFITSFEVCGQRPAEATRKALLIKIDSLLDAS